MHYLISIIFILAISAVHSQNLAIINNNYALKMHRTLIGENSNVLTSPISYLTQLGILQLIADGSTAQEIRHSIGYDSTISSNNIHIFFSNLITRLHNQAKNAFKMKDVMVLRQDYPTTETSRTILKNFYNASIQVYNIYRATETMKNINNLIRQATGSVFQQYLISPLDSYNRLAMLNAVYFSGLWQYQFESIHRGYFYNKGKIDDYSLFPMMSVKGKFSFANLNAYGTELTAVELPYKDGDLKMLFLLPNATGLDGLIQIEQQITASGLSRIVSAMKESKVKVTVPSFKLQAGSDLMWSIQFLGVHEAFNNAADFHSLSREKGLFVTKVLHQMVFELNTHGIQTPSSLNKTEELFIANRPFLFFVRDNSTKMILFMGRVVSLVSK